MFLVTANPPTNPLFNTVRYLVSLSSAGPGNLVLLDGLDSLISKTATIMGMSVESSCIFRPLKHMTTPVLKVAVEPINPSELPRMLLALRSVNKAYPLAVTKVEESGEHIIIGTGELYLDCVLHDLRRLYGTLEIKVSDPIASFAETVQDSSSSISTGLTPNKKCATQTLRSGSTQPLLGTNCR